MGYIITSNGKAKGSYVARRYIGSWKAVDFAAEMPVDYWGRFRCPDAIVFDTVEDALKYKKGNHMEEWKICKYDSCYDSIVSEISE